MCVHRGETESSKEGEGKLQVGEEEKRREIMIHVNTFDPSIDQAFYRHTNHTYLELTKT